MQGTHRRLAKRLATGRTRRLVVIPLALIGACWGAASAGAQTLSVAPCVSPVHQQLVIGQPPVKIPVHGEGWATDVTVFLAWLDGTLNADGSRSPDIAAGSGGGPSSTWDSAAFMPDAIFPLGGYALRPGVYPFTLQGSATDFVNGNPIEQVAQTTTTIVQPGTNVDGVPRIDRRGRLRGKSKLTLFGIDAALAGRRLYGHVLADEHGKQLRSFRVGPAGSGPCTGVTVPKAQRLASARGGPRQYVRFSDQKRFDLANDIQVLSLEVEFRRQRGKAKVGPSFEAVLAGAPLPSAHP